MQKLILFFIVLVFVFSTASGQDHLFEFHSDFEKETLTSYMVNGPKDLLSLQLMADPTVSRKDAELFDYRLNQLIEHFKQKARKGYFSEYFLSTVFFKTHRKLLKHYKKFSPLGGLLKTGNYDCLSATTLYAMLYHELGVDVDIIETNHHIYLKLNTPGDIILIESTDPIHGFITDQDEIEVKLNEVAINNQSESEYSKRSEADYYQFSMLLNEEIDVRSLVGLQYYNQAVVKFNQGDVASAVKLLEKGSVFYNSERFKEFGILLANKLYSDQKINSQTKSDYLQRITDFINVEFIVAAL